MAPSKRMGRCLSSCHMTPSIRLGLPDVISCERSRMLWTWGCRSDVRQVLGRARVPDVVGVAMLAVGMALSYGLYLSASLALPAGDEHPPRLIYGAPFLLKPDLDSPRPISSNVFNQLGYRAVDTAVA